MYFFGWWITRRPFSPPNPRKGDQWFKRDRHFIFDGQRWVDRNNYTAYNENPYNS